MFIKYWDEDEQHLQEIHVALTAISMKMKLQSYEQKLVQGSIIIVAYLNPKILKSTDLAELMVVITIVLYVMQRHYFAEIILTKSKDLPSEASCNSLSAIML